MCPFFSFFLYFMESLWPCFCSSVKSCHLFLSSSVWKKIVSWIMAVGFIWQAFRMFELSQLWVNQNFKVVAWECSLCWHYRMPVYFLIPLLASRLGLGAPADSCSLFPRSASLAYRMIVELHRKVSSLLEFLKQKWALHEVRVVSFSCSVCSTCCVLGEIHFLFQVQFCIVKVNLLHKYTSPCLVKRQIKSQHH